MIIDKIENYKLYKGISNNIDKAFNYLFTTNLSEINLGKHEIDKDNIFAIVSEYETKHISEVKYEGHHKYIDLQYIISGTEFMGTALLTNQIPVEINKEDDYDFYKIKSNLIKFESGMFMIFFPHDLHMPGISLNQASKIRKIVIKIKI
ncbi:MAG: YhcH/YjgK/YiaL family protein [Bacteroidales bacterium]|nr:YhcH/YjgK/YiaL family protein [Bacteroidales bacterium]